MATGYEEYEASEYALAACYLPRTRASSHSRMASSSGTATPPARQPTKWWADGEEPIYYVVSPKVTIQLQHQLCIWKAGLTLHPC